MTTMPPPVINLLDWYWFIQGDDQRVWSSKAKDYVSVNNQDYQSFCTSGTAFVSASEAELFAYLTKQNIPPFHQVPTYRIVRRLEEAGKADAADVALEGNRTLCRRFYTVGNIPAKDPDARAFLVSIGADPEMILAPE